ncbi:MAG: FxLYD domain-containing protein [Syntrophomonas sp.]
MSELLSDIKKLDRTSIAAAVIILLVVAGLITTLVVLLSRPSGSKVTTTTTPPSTAVSKPQTSTTAQTTQTGNAAGTKTESTQANTQTAPAQATEAPPQTDKASNAPADATLPADLTVLTALDPGRFSADSYQLTELRIGHGNIYGTVKSSSQEMFNNITLEITLYDANQTATGVCTVKLTGVKPGSSTKFVKETSSGPCTQYRITGYIAS